MRIENSAKLRAISNNSVMIPLKFFTRISLATQLSICKPLICKILLGANIPPLRLPIVRNQKVVSTFLAKECQPSIK